MSELHPELIAARQALTAGGVRVVKQGNRLVQYVSGVAGPYLMLTVERLEGGGLHVDGRTPERAREVLQESGLLGRART